MLFVLPILIIYCVLCFLSHLVLYRTTSTVVYISNCRSVLKALTDEIAHFSFTWQLSSGTISAVSVWLLLIYIHHYFAKRQHKQRIAKKKKIDSQWRVMIEL